MSANPIALQIIYAHWKAAKDMAKLEKRQQQCMEAHAGLQREAWTALNELIPLATELLQRNRALEGLVDKLEGLVHSHATELNRLQQSPVLQGVVDDDCNIPVDKGA